MNLEQFLAFIDQYKVRDNLNKNDFYQILQSIDENYYKYVKKNDTPRNDTQQTVYYPLYTPQNEYYSIYGTSLIPSNMECYENWVNNHQVEIELPPLQTPAIKNHISINVLEFSITLSGLIDIINKYEYQENTSYNIDLKALHNIKNELIELDGMIGMKDLKSQILDQLLYFIQNLHVNKDSDYKHTIIYGPAGTGKSVCCRLIGKMYSKLGILKNNIFKKVTRSDLVAGYLGQTAIKTNKVIQECLGGVLFIDEVYSLGNKNSDGSADAFSKECIDTLCEALSFYRDDLMVIVAGYKEEIDECFLSVNKGLSSRFIWRFAIDSYNSKELMCIFIQKVSENEWSLSINDIEKWFESKGKNFKNYGRDMELLFSYTKISHGKRVFGKNIDERKILSIDDLNNGYNAFMKNGTEQKEIAYGIYV